MTHEFTPHCIEYLKIIFKCVKCSNTIDDSINVPKAIMEGDGIGCDHQTDNGSIFCSECEKEYEYSISSYGILQFDDLPDDLKIEIEECSATVK